MFLLKKKQSKLIYDILKQNFEHKQIVEFFLSLIKTKPKFFLKKNKTKFEQTFFITQQQLLRIINYKWIAKYPLICFFYFPFSLKKKKKFNLHLPSFLYKIKPRYHESKQVTKIDLFASKNQAKKKKRAIRKQFHLSTFDSSMLGTKMIFVYPSSLEIKYRKPFFFIPGKKKLLFFQMSVI